MGQIDPIWALSVYTVVASIVFAVSYLYSRNARRAAVHAGIGIVLFTALAYLGGLPERTWDTIGTVMGGALSGALATWMALDIRHRRYCRNRYCRNCGTLDPNRYDDAGRES